MPRDVPRGTKTAARAMPRVRSEMAGAQARAKPSGIPRPEPIRRGSRAEALEKIWQASLRAQAFSHGTLGAPGSGKTWHLQDLVGRTLARGPAEIALIHDAKEREAQYRGRVVATVDEWCLSPSSGGSTTIVFHPGDDGGSGPADVARLAFRLARAEVASLVVLDELYHALTPGGAGWEDPQIMSRMLREGASQGISVAWTTQLPQRIPAEAFDLAETVALFRLQRRSVEHVRRSFALDDEACDILPTLGQGEFLLSTPDGWARTIYGPR